MRRSGFWKIFAAGAFLASLVVTILGSGIARAASEVDFFKGKTITYIVATKPGGGYDTNARLISKHMEKYLGATIVIKNVPGAGHIIGANQIYAAKPDGLTFGTFNTGLIYAQLVNQPGIKFDLRKFTWIGKASSEARVLVVSAKSPYRTFDDLKKAKEVKLGSSGVGSAAYNENLMISRAFGININIIAGYSGREDELAMRRGEIEGTIASYSSFERFVKEGEGRILLQIAAKKHPDLRNVPLASDIVPAKGNGLINLISATAEISRFTAGPPGIPAARAQFLIEAYRKALTDPELLAQAQKAELPIDPLYGQEVAKLISEAFDQPQENVDLLRKIVKEEK